MSFLDKMSGKNKGILLAVIGLIGILLIVIGTIGEKRQTNADTGTAVEKNLSTLEYIETLENKIKTITEQITGSDHVKVIVSIASGPEYIYVSNEELDENYSAKEYITVRTENGSDELILLKEIYPEIEGVSVACPGGDNPELQAKLIEVISTALDVSSNRICIVGTKS
ncbi:MAG: hypothetical protein DBY04_01760 [Clostridiales bacterium]|nr:MAG: hypothetical protein DBY04_01760 [Clostridiales bacterium]